ncbi:hypothetical protein [Brevundimonas viscosa]|uniref:Uncharacterized protein n=1 Tax=Brevundimonas viscosa TaxID=871741 RepID=A0A1I6TL89_9CAUL|nr:hypothetical protein [Brevundimonas viscosa]SFS89946.1 hypothetical protein SAMN05192570_0151 [Brevundimonas viscosa]
MKRLLAAAGLSAALVMTGCSQPDEDARPETAAPAAVEMAAPASENAPGEMAALPAGPVAGGAATPAAPGAPAFAVLYPGAAPKSGPVRAQGPSGPGGTLEFTTDATPDEVVDFYRQRAEAAGLKAITSLNRDGARGYAAGDGADGRGQMLNVVATPVEDGPTDVLLMWSSGR